jgi:hypothetical protein
MMIELNKFYGLFSISINNYNIVKKGVLKINY